MSEHFSPLKLEYAILTPLRKFFSDYAGEDFKYSNDIRQTKIVIKATHDLNSEEVNHAPRIIVDRGGYTITKNFITEGMSSQDPLGITKGLTKQKRHAVIAGEAAIIVEAREQGTCELLTEMTSLFLAWTGDHICRTYGFKKYADPLSISPCMNSKNDDDIFQCQIRIPYQAEMLWKFENDAVILKDIGVDLR